MAGINLEHELQKERAKRLKHAEEETLQAFKRVLQKDDELDWAIMDRLFGDDQNPMTSFELSNMDASRVYSLAEIKTICVRYRLRFLDSKYFKGEIPPEAMSAIKTLQKENQVELEGFKIVAPAELFNLKERDKDPMLFVPIGNQNYYLVHRWGGDLNPWRRILSWPLQTFPNMVKTVFGAAFLGALSVPHNVMVPDPSMASWPIRGILFFWLLIALCGMTTLYVLGTGKNFNDAEWNSRYRV